jgi:beta-lactamase class A
MEKVIPRRQMSATFLETIERVTRSLPGAFSVCAERLDRAQARLAANEELVLPAASVIKLAIALEVLCAIEEGTLERASRITLRESDKVMGSGVLAALEPGLELTITDLLYLAMAISDNTAANVLVERVGTAAVNARLASLGLTTTRLRGRIFVAGEDGERSPSTAAELVALLRSIHRAEGLPARACEELLALLARTQTASTIGRGLPDARFPRLGGAPPAIALAYKTGSLEGIVVEAAIVTLPGATYAIAVMSEGSGDARPNHDNVGRIALGEVSRAVYETFRATT